MPVPALADPTEARSWIAEVNSGIIAVAGMALGLAGAEVDPTTTYVVILINMVAGALTVFGVHLARRYADLDAQQRLIAREEQLLRQTPAQEMDELVAWLQRRGAAPADARTVAQQVFDRDPMAAMLELHGLDAVATAAGAWYHAALSGLAFLTGALLPVLATTLVPWEWHMMWTVAAVLGSLVVTAIALSRMGHSSTLRTILRSLAVGTLAIAATYVLGDLLL